MLIAAHKAYHFTTPAAFETIDTGHCLIFILGGEVAQVFELRRVRRMQREVFTDADRPTGAIVAPELVRNP